MIERAQAEEHLRVIRSLMEKATIYRAISAEAAAVGGLLAVAGSFAFGNPWSSSAGHGPVSAFAFLGLWLGILAITAGANLLFLWREAHRRNEAFGSSGMRLALRALLPSYVVAGALTLVPGPGTWASQVVPVWIVCHGVALLATGHFAPRSLVWLGWAFLIAGLVAMGPGFHSSVKTVSDLAASTSGADALVMDRNVLNIAQRWMAGTFGGFHLIYAAFTWPRKSKA